MVERDRSGLPDDPWEELLHQGDVSERSVTAIPLVVAALAGGTDDDADWLYLLAALCIGRPERLAERIRSAAQAGAATYRRLLAGADDDARAGAIAALTAARASDDRDRERFATLAAGDPATVVRAHAALALGLEPGHERELENLLGDDDPVVAHAAALALAQLGQRDERIVLALARALIDAADSPTERPPWEAFYPDWTEELVELGADARPALPLIIDAVERAEPWLAVELVRTTLTIGSGDEEMRRDLARRLVGREELWQRADFEYVLRDNGLPESRPALQAWLVD